MSAQERVGKVEHLGQRGLAGESVPVNSAVVDEVIAALLGTDGHGGVQPHGIRSRQDAADFVAKRFAGERALGTVVAAFPATGKTHYAAGRPGVVDSDSSSFSRTTGMARHPDWPVNYMLHIKALRPCATILVSTHAEVRKALAAGGVPFTLVYPHPSLKDEYIERMKARGDWRGFTDVIERHWDGWLMDCTLQDGCEKVVLGPGQYLSDVLR